LRHDDAPAGYRFLRPLGTTPAARRAAAGRAARWSGVPCAGALAPPERPCVPDETDVLVMNRAG